MAIKKKFIHFKKKESFQRELEAGNILNTSIVFIADAKQIYLNGSYFSENTLFNLSELLDTVSGELRATDTTNEAVIKLYKKLQDVLSGDVDVIKFLVEEIHNLEVSLNERIDTTDEIVATGLASLNNKLSDKVDIEGVQSAIEALNLPGTYETIENVKTLIALAQSKLQNSLNNHKADQDKKHIPTGGHERQILAWKADGEAQWEDLANMFTGLEELLAYGVEWDATIADPHLTRIGNMSLHKTLPIQSQLKGCIAQVDKVIYWLDENDWRFRKDASTITVDLTEDTETFVVPSVAELGINQYLRDGENLAKITAIDTDASTITVEWELPEIEGEDSIDLTTITTLEVGSRLDGYDGTVRVYCPNFYIKSQIIGNTRRVWLSTVKIDNTWTLLNEILIDAYRSTVLREVPSNMGYLSTLPVNSAISVVNTSAYCRGLENNADLDAYLEISPFNTGLGKPAVSLSRATMRTYCRNAGNEMLSYEQYKNIFYWLWVVEYANFNSQEPYNSALTTDGYHQGGMGNGVTTSTYEVDVSYGLIPCGYMNEFGNRTGIKTATFSNGNTVQVPRWRGFDNPFGDILTNLDSIIIDADVDNHPNNMAYVYTCQDPEKYADNLDGEGYEKVCEAVYNRSTYILLYDLGDAAHIIPNVLGGAGTMYKCDYCSVSTLHPTILKTLIVGGHAGSGGGAGLSYLELGCATYFKSRAVGFRSVSQFMSSSLVE